MSATGWIAALARLGPDVVALIKRAIPDGYRVTIVLRYPGDSRGHLIIGDDPLDVVTLTLDELASNMRAEERERELRS